MLNFLHFTDLHFGLGDQDWLWPNIKHAFFADLERLRERSGPWQVVLFTGDLVQRGSELEFERLEDRVLGPLWEHFDTLGCNPLLLAVPGNHDLQRPKTANPAVQKLLEPGGFRLIAREFFEAKESPHRDIVDNAFENYSSWWTGRAAAEGLEIEDGLLPGDFAVTIRADSYVVGVVGLNSTFLQLSDMDPGLLTLDLRQLHEVCGGDPPGWAARHDICFLLTHQGPYWLTPESRDELFSEIAPAGRFAVHFFGHEHQLQLESRALAGEKARQQWQGSSLFGLEKYGNPPRTDRRHGYGAGRVDFTGGKASMEFWPRKAFNRGGGWHFMPDHEACQLDEARSSTLAPVVRNARQRQNRPSSDPTLWTLGRAQDDLKNQLKQAGLDEPIEVQHIGLDLFTAQTRLIDTIGDLADWRDSVRTATLKLLVITDDVSGLGRQVPESVKEMSGRVTSALDAIVKELNPMKDRFARQRKRLRIEIRAYRDLPTIHGFCLLQGGGQLRPIATYFSFCRWNEGGEDLEWGSKTYRRVLGRGAEPSSADLVTIFARTFHHLWRTSDEKRAVDLGL